jgi:hypothetical protein
MCEFNVLYRSKVISRKEMKRGNFSLDEMDEYDAREKAFELLKEKYPDYDKNEWDVTIQ